MDPVFKKGPSPNALLSHLFGTRVQPTHNFAAWVCLDSKYIFPLGFGSKKPTEGSEAQLLPFLLQSYLSIFYDWKHYLHRPLFSPHLGKHREWKLADNLECLLSPRAAFWRFANFFNSNPTSNAKRFQSSFASLNCTKPKRLKRLFITIFSRMSAPMGDCRNCLRGFVRIKWSGAESHSMTSCIKSHHAGGWVAFCFLGLLLQKGRQVEDFFAKKQFNL